jgi:hypothetical protein
MATPNAPSKKRQASITSPIQAPKRPRSTPPPPNSGSALLRLPREIRDHIYSLALGTNTLLFRHDDLTLEGVSNIYGRLHRNAAGLEGLPQWLQTNKQVCSKALQVVAQTYAFEIQCPRRHDLDRLRRKIRSLGPQLPAPPNPLVLNGDVLRHIATYPRITHDNGEDILNIQRSRLDQTSSHVTLLRQLKVQDVCLESDWRNFWVLESKVVEGPEAFTEEWRGNDWDRKFRKVRITIEAPYESEHSALATWVPKLTEMTEECAKRLVGRNGVVTWSDLLGSAERCVVVERKI